MFTKGEGMEGDHGVVQVVWLKRDLRLVDHQPFVEAARQGGKVVALYMYEPIVIEAADYSDRHHGFINQTLVELGEEIRALGGCLWIKQGGATEVLQWVYDQLGTFRLLSHEEIGHSTTYQRDLEVSRWCMERGWCGRSSLKGGGEASGQSRRLVGQVGA